VVTCGRNTLDSRVPAGAGTPTGPSARHHSRTRQARVCGLAATPVLSSRPANPGTRSCEGPRRAGPGR
jgi:hypothetical protein